MVDQVVAFRNKLREQLFHMVLFATLFTLIGWAVPDIYVKYLDKTEYYKIEVPIRVEKQLYQACDYVDVYIKRNSLINTNAKVILELTLIRNSGQELDEVYRETRDIVIQTGETTQIAHWPLPCFIKPGTYYFGGNANYKVNGIDKYTPFKTEAFQVIEGQALPH
jgi:hypothetical protein